MRRLAVVLIAVLLAACSSDDDTAPSPTAPASTPSTAVVTAAPVSSPTGSPTTVLAPTSTVEPEHRYRASITRTAYGVPHIVADDWGSLGFGQGFAFAEDRACTLIDQVIKVRGERAKWFGPGEDDANIESDFAYRQLGLHDDADERFGHEPQRIVEMIDGYVAGFNAELGASGPVGWCAGEPWVQAITTTDLYAYLNDVLLFASSGVLLDPIASARPPAADGPRPPATDGAAVPSGSAMATTTSLGSNAWAIGSALSDSGGGMLLGNPHFPWEGEKRLWESQLTLTTGELNVYGATLSGVPGVLIGFNEHVAWSHTVSAGYRMTLYSLQLVPGDPTSYTYGGETRTMTSKDVTIDVKQDDGSVAPQSRTMWSSHYGPMLNLPFGWTADTAYTMRDANLENSAFLEQYVGMDAAMSMDEFIDVHRTANAVPWVNTVATSSDGRAWYADTAATPNLSPAAIAGWQAEVDAGGLAKTVLDNGAILLDGSDPVNEWVDDPAAARPGILPFSAQPQLERDDFVFNANDSHWLANPATPLTGFSPLTGPEGVEQSARTRENATLLTDPVWRGADGTFSLDEVQAAILSNHSLVADLLLPALRADCAGATTATVDGAPVDVTEACAVIAAWDGQYDIESVGAVLFREFLAASSPNVWADPFDAADPIGTPGALNGDPSTVLAWLGSAAAALESAGHPIDAPLGDLQFDDRYGVGERIGLGGGQGIDGTASVLTCCSNPSTLAPKGDPGTWGDRFNFTELGYPVSTGDSFVFTVAYGADGPQAGALLTYGQTDDTSSPAFTEQTELLAAGRFRPVLFTDAAIAADPTATKLDVTGD